MKIHRKLLGILFMFANVVAFAQTDVRPIWTKRVPNPPTGANYFFSWGMGEGNSELQAINHAWADALQKSLHELGAVGITQQDIDAVAKKGIDAVVSFNKMKRRQLCVANAIRKANGSVMVYVLIQVQRSIHGKDDFYEVNPDLCHDPDFNKKLKELDGDYDFSPRVFVPGMAQIYKGSTGKGVFFIVGEIALLGGVVACEGLRASYDSKISTTHNAQNRRNYINNADNMQNLRNGFIAGAVALYAWNVIDGMVAKGKKHVVLGSSNLRFSPYVSPHSNGVVLSYKF